MSELSFGSGVFVGWCAASLCMVVAGAIHWWKKGEPQPVLDGWRNAFEDSRARGQNTDAYTFQIAWAYARDYFGRIPASEGEQK